MPADPPAPASSPAPQALPAPRAAPRGPARWLLAAFALLCLLLGLIGVVVPGMPTTVFILLAAWAAARSSPRLHAWLLAHPMFGPMLRDWQAGGRVSRRAKRSATLMMALCALLLPLTPAPLWAAALSATSMAAVLLWLWRRPEPPPEMNDREAEP